MFNNPSSNCCCPYAKLDKPDNVKPRYKQLPTLRKPSENRLEVQEDAAYPSIPTENTSPEEHYLPARGIRD